MSKKSKEIHLKISEEEYSMLKQQQDFLKYSSVSQVIRAYIHSGHCYRFDMSGLYDFSTQISRVGNNINQIAAAVNETYSVTPYQIKFHDAEFALKNRNIDLSQINSSSIKILQKRLLQAEQEIRELEDQQRQNEREINELQNYQKEINTYLGRNHEDI